MSILKICGLSQAEDVAVCAALGVEYLGFVAYPASPRHVSPEQFHALLPFCDTSQPVLVTVDASDDWLESYLAPTQNVMLQLHGAESPARLAALKQRYARRMIKAITHPAQAADYADSADFLLMDAKPTAGELPGGNARTADWAALAGFSPALPWFLSGGLHVQNVAEALRITGAKMLDVSSSVERERGIKDIKLIEEFVHATRC